ncbi:hypothetical protein D3C76_745010 [compost metagenome]
MSVRKFALQRQVLFQEALSGGRWGLPLESRLHPQSVNSVPGVKLPVALSLLVGWRSAVQKASKLLVSF